MSDSKVFMFPENGYNNNDGLLGGWGGGMLTCAAKVSSSIGKILYDCSTSDNCR